MELEELKKDFEKWNKQGIICKDGCDLKFEFGLYLVKEYHQKDEEDG